MEDFLKSELLTKPFWVAAVGETQSLMKDFCAGMNGEVVKEQIPDRSINVLGVFCVMSLACFVLNWSIRWFVVEPFARLLLQRPNGKSAKIPAVQKFAQSAMEAVTYLVFFLLGLWTVPRQQTFWPSIHWWQYEKMGPVPRDVTAFYILYCARYFQGGISVLLEHKRKDFLEMQIHHWVTVVLVGLSYQYDWLRTGLIVMFLLDPADVPLHIAKLFKYVSDSGAPKSSKRTINQTIADICFAIFAIVFFGTRIVMMPYVMISGHTESLDLGVGGSVCVGLLWVLYVLQCYWMYLIISATVKMFKNGGIEDVRSDDEDSSDFGDYDEGNKKKND